MKTRYCFNCDEEITDKNRSKWTPYWCLPCDKIRRAGITKSLKEIQDSFKEKNE